MGSISIVDPPELQESFPVGPRIPAEARLAHPVLGETVEIDIGPDDLGAVRKSLRFREEVAVFIDHGVTVPGQIRRRFPRPCRGVEVGGDAAGGLICGQALPVFRFSDGHVGGGEISDDGCPRQGGKAGGGDGDPDVLAHLQERSGNGGYSSPRK